MHPRTCSIASVALRPLCASLQATSRACVAGLYRRDGDGLARAFGSLHEADAYMGLNVVAHQNLLLERIRSTAAAAKSRKQVLKVETSAKASAKAALSTESCKGIAARSSGKWIASSCVGIEARIAKLVVLLSLLRVGEDLVGSLDLAKLVFGRGVLVRIGVELLC